MQDRSYEWRDRNSNMGNDTGRECREGKRSSDEQWRNNRINKHDHCREDDRECRIIDV